MGNFFSILLDIIAILGVIILGAIIVVVVADLILCLFDDHDGIIIRRGKKENKEDKSEDAKSNKSIQDDEIVVYSSEQNPNTKDETKSVETIDGDKVEEIDYDKAVEEQKMLAQKQGVVVQEAPKAKPAPVEEKKVEEAPDNDDIFWDDDEDDEFNNILDEIFAEAKKPAEDEGKDKKEDKKAEKAEEKPVVDEEAEKKKAEEEAKRQAQEEETKRELEELKALKEQQQKELEEFKQMKEDFAREKEEQLALLKENLDKVKTDEIERIRQEALREQEKLEKMQDELEEQKDKLAEEREKLRDERSKPQEKQEVEPIVKETIIKDEEEINKMKYKNLMRMNNRLTRIIRDTERLQVQKQKEQEKQEEERRKILAKQQEEKIKEQERRLEIQRENQERLAKQQEALIRKSEITRKLSEASRTAGKYKLDSKVVKVVKEQPVTKNEEFSKVVEEEIITTTKTIPHNNATVESVEREPLKASAKPIFAKEYYEARLSELEEELRDAEKELRMNKSEFIPLTRIHKAYERDSEKLRKKEMQVAKQKVALYGVNSKNVDPVKKQKLDENLQALAELKDSVQHCEEVIKKNKDRFPIIEKNNKLINKQIDRINADIKVCEKAIEYYNKK